MWTLPRLWHRRPNDCGPCCLGLVARYYGLQCDLRKARAFSGWRWSGTSLLGLAQAASRMGMESSYARLSLRGLLDAALPCIAHLRANHFVVVREVGPQGVLVTDPLTGQSRMPLGEFDSHWDGAVLLLWPIATGRISGPEGA